MKHNYLTVDDQVFIYDLIAHTRASMQFSILKSPPQESDLVFLSGEQMPFFLPVNSSKTFTTLGELVKLCESHSHHTMIYEAFIRDAFNNIRSATSAMSADDGERLIAYYKAYQGLDDTTSINAAANEAINEARAALYGDLSDDDDDYDYD